MNRITRKIQIRRIFAASAAGALLAVHSWAGDAVVATVASNDVTVTAKSAEYAPMQKVGEARLKVLLWSVYDSRLYTPSGSYDDGDLPLRLEIQYLRDIQSQDLVKRTLAEWEAMGREHPRQLEWRDILAGMWPDIEASDVLTLELDKDGIATFLHNGRVLGQVNDPEFGQQFVDIWLSRDCTRPKLREALLGNA